MNNNPIGPIMFFGLIRKISVIILVILLPGCLPSPVFTESSTEIQFRPKIKDTPGLLIIGESECQDDVAEEMHNERPEWRVYSGVEMRKQIYPWLEMPYAQFKFLETRSQLEHLLSIPLVAHKLKNLDINAAIFIAKETDKVTHLGGCIISPQQSDCATREVLPLPTFYCVIGNPFGCVGLAAGEIKSNWYAELLTLPDADIFAKITVSASGEALALAWAIPVFFVPPTETIGCANMAEEIINFFSTHQNQQ